MNSKRLKNILITNSFTLVFLLREQVVLSKQGGNLKKFLKKSREESF